MKTTDKFHDRNVAAVREKMKKRAEVGLKKYGQDTTREDFTLNDWLNELQQELMDATVYIEAVMHKLK